MNTPEYIISQIIVVIASIILGSTYLTKNKTLILILSITATSLFGLEYAILHIWPGVVINIVGIVRCIWFFVNNKYNKVQDILSMVVIQILCITGGIWSFAGWIDILPILAAVVISYGLWQNNIKIYRISMLIMDTCFLLYNCLLNPPLIMGIVIQIIMCTTGIVSTIMIFTRKDAVKKSNL